MLKFKSFIFIALVLVSLSSIVLADSDLSFVFLDSPQKVEVVVGSSAIAEVKVRNIGDSAETVELSVETTAPVSVGVVPGAVVVDQNRDATFTLSFLSSPTNLVDSHQSSFRLRGNGVDEKRDFTIVILPSPEKKFEINNDYLSTLNKFEGLQKRFDEIKNIGCVFVNPGDVSAITPKQVISTFQDLKDVLEKTRIAIKENDFVTANVNGERAKTILGRSEGEINTLKVAQEVCEEEQTRVSGYLTGGAVTTTIGVVVIVVLLGLLAYKKYTNAPKVRKLLPSGVPVRTDSGEPAKPKPYEGMERLGQRKEFQFDFKRKDEKK